MQFLVKAYDGESMLEKSIIDEELSYRKVMVVIGTACPRCGKELLRKNQAFCGECGQKLDWKAYSKNKASQMVSVVEERVIRTE